MIGYDFRVHQAGVFLLVGLLACRPVRTRLLMLLRHLVIAVRVLCDHRVSHHHYNCARDYG